jgi:transcriptional regulator with XRE-family HTH domain
MARKKKRVHQAEIVKLFAQRLRQRRNELGLTQEALAHAARITPSYVWRLESGGASPGVDLVARLAAALNTTISDLLPEAGPPPDKEAAMRDQARKLLEDLLRVADRETLQMLCPMLARLLEAETRGR